MTVEQLTPRGQSAMERIVLHVVQVITVAAILGGYGAVSELTKSVAVLQTQLEAMSDRLDDFRGNAKDRYTGTQALRDLAPVIKDINDHEARLRQLERAAGRRD